MLGRERAIVVSGAGGMDEASLAGQNTFVLLDKGDLIPFSLTADEVGLAMRQLQRYVEAMRRKMQQLFVQFSTGNEDRISIQSCSMQASDCLPMGM